MKHDLGVAHALTWRYVIALSLVATLSTAAWVSLHLVISEQKSTAAVVNVSGRQRMLSQRTALFSNLLMNTPKAERPFIRGKLKDAIDLMARSHRGLIHGDNEMGLPETMSPAVRSMYFDGANALDGQVETYIKTVQALLLLDDNELTPENPLFQYVTKAAPTTLVSALDQMVLQYQLEGEASVGSLQKAETIFWVVTLLLLLLEAMLIFHPFVKHVRTIIGKLQRVTDELQLHQDSLEVLVRQRTAELESRSEALAESEEKFRLISTAAQDAITIIGADGQVIYWNPAAEKIFGYKADEAMGKNLHTLLTPIHYHDAAHSGFEHFRHSGEGDFIGKTFETTALRKSGEEFPIELSISSVRLKNSWHALGIIRDVTERKFTEDQIRNLAFYDTLTQLPNRRLLNDRLGQTIASSRRSGQYGALMFLDLDNFKPLNDLHGHKVGDLLLIEAARRIAGCIRQMDTVARFGGDEFVVTLSELDADKAASIAHADIVAERIRATLAYPYRLTISQDGSAEGIVEHHCTASIGVVVFNYHADLEDILRWADMAMYAAKKGGRNRVVISQQGSSDTSAVNEDATICT